MTTEPTKQRDGDQVLPTGSGRCVQDFIIEAMEESKRVGIERYGSPLRTFNGRRGLRDAREEARDLFVYLTMLELEADARADEVAEVVRDVLAEALPLAPLALNALAVQIVERVHGHVARPRTVDAAKVHSDLMSIIGYSCETQAPNSEPTEEYITDRWMKPRLDALVEYVVGGTS